MLLDALAQRLSDRGRIGLDPKICDTLGIASADAMRGRLMAAMEDDRTQLGMYLLACYVVDDTDFWSDGEIYWWSIPAIVATDGTVLRDALHGLPTGAPPHKCGDNEWMTNFSLRDPPLLAAIPPDSSVASCIVHLAIYDDDGAKADVPTALGEGLRAFAALPEGPHAGPDHIIKPVRQAIWDSLKADEDDILIDQQIVLRRGEVTRFGLGMVGSVVNAMARVYYFVRDEGRTQQFGPVALHKGQSETIRFDEPLKAPGRLAVFARGADVSCAALGDLTSDTPFQNRVIEARQEESLAHGVQVVGKGPAKLVAFYTPA